MAQLSGLRAYLKAIEEGDFADIDVAAFTKKFENDGFKYGDHLQYSLHKFCRQSEKPEIELTVINLSKLCFCKESAVGFNNMDRFLGSLFHITSYFLKRHSYSVALEISKSVDVKKTEIEKLASDSVSIRNVLYSLHSLFVASAQGIASKIVDSSKIEEMQLSYDLAQLSLRFLQFIKFKQLETGKKIFRNFKNYFNSLQFYEKRNMYALYTGVEGTLSDIMPMYKNNNFLHYYIIRLDQIEHEDQMDYRDLSRYFQKQLRLISVFMNDSKTLKYWELLLSGDMLSEKHLVNFTSKAALIVANKQSKLHLLAMSIFFNHVAQLWIKNYTNNWTEIFSAKILKKLYNGILLPMKSIIKNLTELCTVADYQLDMCFTDSYHVNLLWILHLIRLCLKYSVADSLELVPLSREVFRYLQKSLSESRSLCCLAKKKQYWSSLVVHYTNTVEGLLRQTDSHRVWTFMKECCEELLCEIMNTELELPYEWKRVKILFQRWHYACLKLKDFDEALFISTFFMVSYPTEEEDALSMWIQTKKCLSSDIRQSLTFKDIIDREQDRMKCMNPNCKPLAQDLRKLLMMELMAYSSCPAFYLNTSDTVMKLLNNIWEILKNLDLDLCDRAAALNNVIVAAISSNDSKSMEKYKKECEDVVAEILIFGKNVHDCRSLLYAGNLKYALFLCRLKSIQDAEDKISSSKSILEYLKKEEEQKVKFGEDVDLNLTCNVMPSTNHFTVSFEENYLKALNETWSFWGEAAERVKSTSLESYEFNAWLHNIKQISQMYYLIGDVQQSFLSWMLYYRVAKVCNNRSSILLALSQIIPECTYVENTKLGKEAEEIAKNLVEDSKDRDILILYWLAVALNHLKNRNGNECLNYLCKMKNLISNMKESTKFLVYHARYWCLVSKFLCLYPDQFDKFELKSGTELIQIVFKAFIYANNAVKNGSACSLGSGDYMEVLLTVLEVNLWAYNFYSVYSQVTFMKFFLDDLYQIFQKLVLPTRTAFVLALLAEVDIMCEKVEDANTKLSSLKRILGTSHVSSAEKKHVPRKMSDTLKVPKYAEEDRASPRALSPARFLEVHDVVKERDPSPLRYVLNEVDLTERLAHTGKCKCYTCRSIIIKFLYVNALLLEAQLNHLNGCIKKSCVYYKEGYNSQKKLESYQWRLSEKISKAGVDFKGIVDFQGDLVRTNSVKFLMHYALFMLSTVREEKKEDVDKLIGMIDKTLLALSFEEKIFKPRIVELKLTSFTIHELKDTAEDENKGHTRVVHSPNRIPIKTPVATRKPEGNAAPMKYKPLKVTESPNDFISKPSGRKIFSDDEKETPSQEKTTSSKKNTRKKVEVAKKRTMRKKKIYRRRNRIKERPKTYMKMSTKSSCGASNGQSPSRMSLQTVQTMSLAKTLHVQDQIIEQLRADHSALREALEAERNTLRDCRITSDRELKALQRENLQINKIKKQQELKIEELEKALAFSKEVLASEQKNLKSLEKEHINTVKELKLRNSKEYDKANKQEMLIDQLKSEVEDLKAALESERNATNLLIREHNAEVKMLRVEVRTKSTEAYRELKERAMRERDEYREMQEEAEKTYKVLEKDFRDALAAKDEELKKVKAEARLIQKELEDQLRASLKEPTPHLNSPPAPNEYYSGEKVRRLKNEVSILRDQNRKLLNELQLVAGEEKMSEIKKEHYFLPFSFQQLESGDSKAASEGVDPDPAMEVVFNADKASRTEINRLGSEANFKSLPKRGTKSVQSFRKEEPVKPYVRTKTEERYHELKRTMMILRNALQ